MHRFLQSVRSSTSQKDLWHGLVFSALLFGGLFLLLSSVRANAEFLSVEVKFADASKSRLAIVPASCPSDPHVVGECGPDYAQSSYPPTYSQGYYQGDYYNQAYYYGQSYYQSYYQGYYQSYYQGGYPPIVEVEPPVCPDGFIWNGVFCERTSCPEGYVLVTGTCVRTSCPAGYILFEGECIIDNRTCNPQFSCVGNNLYSHSGITCARSLVPVQACQWGCAPGGCLDAPSPNVVTWRVAPLLVRSESTTLVTWDVRFVVSCTVTGDNGDSWTDDTGTGSVGTHRSSGLTRRTVFTLNCAGFDGTRISLSKTVNIVPVFDEQ